MAEAGLRERKKQLTRQRIVAEAIELFAERGFDKVPVAEIARRAEVSEATVFNYFPSKDDIFYEGRDAFERAIVTAVRDRPEGTSITEAFADYVFTGRRGHLTEGTEGLARIARAARIVAGSPTLQDRERRTTERHARELADVIADGIAAEPGDLRPYVMATALLGIARAMQGSVHAAALAAADGESAGPDVADEVLARGRAALDQLERGLAALGAARAHVG